MMASRNLSNTNTASKNTNRYTVVAEIVKVQTARSFTKEKRICVVATNWLTENNKQFWYPPELKEKHLLDRTTPDKETWFFYDVFEILGVAEKCVEANAIIRRIKSDVTWKNIDVDLDSTFDSCSSASDGPKNDFCNGIAASPPASNQDKNLSAASPTATPIDKSPSTASPNASTGDTSPSMSEKNIVEKDFSPLEQSTPKTSSTYELCVKILERVEQLEKRIFPIKKSLFKKKQNISYNSKKLGSPRKQRQVISLVNKLKLPIRTTEQVKQLKEDLLDPIYEKDYIRVLKRCSRAGKDVEEQVKLMLNDTCSGRISKLYNMTGKSKLRFTDTPMYEKILKECPKEEEAAVYCITEKWLKNQNDQLTRKLKKPDNSDKDLNAFSNHRENLTDDSTESGEDINASLRHTEYLGDDDSLQPEQHAANTDHLLTKERHAASLLSGSAGVLEITIPKEKY